MFVTVKIEGNQTFHLRQTFSFKDMYSTKSSLDKFKKAMNQMILGFFRAFN